MVGRGGEVRSGLDRLAGARNENEETREKSSE